MGDDKHKPGRSSRDRDEAKHLTELERDATLPRNAKVKRGQPSAAATDRGRASAEPLSEELDAGETIPRQGSGEQAAGDLSSIETARQPPGKLDVAPRNPRSGSASDLEEVDTLLPARDVPALSEERGLPNAKEPASKPPPPGVAHDVVEKGSESRKETRQVESPAVQPAREPAAKPCDKPAEPSPAEALPARERPQAIDAESAKQESSKKSTTPVREILVPAKLSLPETGQKVGNRFTLVRKLGEGGMGVVWLAKDNVLDTEVALKMLSARLGADPQALEDLRQETRKSQELAHPHIIRIHDLHVPEGELPFISMEYVDGQNLKQFCAKQPQGVLTWEQLQPLIKVLCETLEYAHKRQLIHRDLKPSNVMLDGNLTLKLADFGISARMTESMTRVTRRSAAVASGGSGTPAYMSPQQMNGAEPRVTDDVYALGATMYELLTSRPPFFSGDIWHQVQTEPPKALAERLSELGVANEVPDFAGELVMACLTKEPGQRPQSVREMLDRLEPAPVINFTAVAGDGKLLELCEPLFLYICALNRLAKLPEAAAKYEFRTLRFEIDRLFGEMRAKVAANTNLEQQFQKVELPLLCWIDATISESLLGCAKQWEKEGMARERNEHNGDERFFKAVKEALAEAGLKQKREQALDRLGVYYVCLGLGYGRAPEEAKQLLDSILPQLRSAVRTWDVQILKDPLADTTNLITPPSHWMSVLAASLVGLALATLLAHFWMSSQGDRTLSRSIQTILRMEAK